MFPCDRTITSVTSQNVMLAWVGTGQNKGAKIERKSILGPPCESSSS